MSNAAAVIRTVRGDIAPQELGVCYPHEHLIGGPPGERGDANPDFVLDSEDAAIQELTAFREAGGRAVVEMSTPDYRRDPAALRRISEAANVHIVAATGHNKETFSAPFLRDATVEELAGRFAREVSEGMDGTDIRAGVIKAASTLNELSPLAEKLFRAAAQAHHASGAPISTHTEAGTMAAEQVALLASEGVEAQHVIVGHIDRRLDWDNLIALARSGVYLGFDQISKDKYCPDRLRVAYIRRLVAQGHGQQILLSGDMARRSYWPAYGAGGSPGFTYILWRFIPWLLSEGLGEEAIRDLLIRNPARALAFTPRA